MLHSYESHQELIGLVSLGNHKAVKEVLSAMWDPNVTNEDGITPILKAAERNDLPMLKTLIDAGARVNIADFFGITPLYYAQIHKNQDMISIIEKTLESQIKLRNDCKK